MVEHLHTGECIHRTLTISNAQESYCRLLAQLRGGPEPLTRELGSGGVVNQPNQVEILGHCRELPVDGMQ